MTNRSQIRAFLALLLVLIVLFTGCDAQDAAMEESHGGYKERYTIAGDGVTVDGVTYRLRPNTTAILVMGIDPDGDRGISDNRHGGQADFLQLIVFDDANKCISRLEIDRDTITAVHTLTVLGKDGGQIQTQICLAHGYGDGKEQSCELELEAVNGLLAASIQYYYAINLNGLITLNDAVGGVEVTLDVDFTDLDPTMTAGTTMTLHGKQAEYFCRTRMTVGDGLNTSRMARQRQYLSALLGKMAVVTDRGESAVASLYESLKPYVVTNMSDGRLVNQIWKAKDYAFPDPIQVDGVHQYGSDGYMEFYPDTTQLRNAVLRLLYEPV